MEVGVVYALLVPEGLLDMPRGVEVFGGDPKRFKEGNLIGVDAAGFCAGQDFAQFSFDMVFGDDAFLLRDQEVAGFIEERTRSDR